MFNTEVNSQLNQVLRSVNTNVGLDIEPPNLTVMEAFSLTNVHVTLLTETFCFDKRWKFFYIFPSKRNNISTFSN